MKYTVTINAGERNRILVALEKWQKYLTTSSPLRKELEEIKELFHDDEYE